MSDSASSEPSPTGGGPLAHSGPVFAALTGLTSLGILLEAVFAGKLINSSNTGGWLSAHDANADVLVALAVLTAIYASVVLRATARPLVIGSIVLAALVIAQTAIGHAITSGSDNGLLVIHVPLAMLVFGLTIWLSVSARTLRTSFGG